MDFFHFLSFPLWFYCFVLFGYLPPYTYGSFIDLIAHFLLHELSTSQFIIHNKTFDCLEVASFRVLARVVSWHPDRALKRCSLWNWTIRKARPSNADDAMAVEYELHRALHLVFSFQLHRQTLETLQYPEISSCWWCKTSKEGKTMYLERTGDRVYFIPVPKPK